MTEIRFLLASLSYITVLVLMMVTECFGQDIAHRSPSGALLCPLVEDFYSYKRSASYGPDRWSEISECCAGHRQSPRNLHSGSKSLCELGHGSSFSYNNTMGLLGSLYNNGHDPNIAFPVSNTAHLFHAPYTNEPYILDNIHIHFCSDPLTGSEHAIDGRFYQGEIHLVHFKASYGSLGTAILHEDGPVVIAIMIQAVPIHERNVNGEMFQIIQRMNHLQGVGREFQIPIHVNVAEIFPQSKAFFTYAGSLTSPPCSESVRWIVLKEPINVSTNEMDILRRLPSEERRYIVQGCNDRPLQNGNTIIETNFACTSHQAIRED